MTAQNLAAIFQPGIISHPNHDMAPKEYRLSQDVLIFLIENQDNFLIGMTGTAMDEKTKDEVKSGPPSINTPKATTLGRSASTASAGADSLRRTTGLRRNASLSSRNSRDRSSPGVSGPGTPVSPGALGGSVGTTGSLGRSNTVPSNRSPAMSGRRFQRIADTNEPSTPTVNTPATIPGSPPDERTTRHEATAPASSHGTDGRPSRAAQQLQTLHAMVAENDQIAEPAASMAAAQDVRPTQESAPVSPVNGRQTRERKISNLLAKSPIFGPLDGQRDSNRQPRKLQKRRIPGSSNESAQSSQASLHADDVAAFHTPMGTPGTFTHDRQNPMEGHYPVLSTTAATPNAESPSESYARSPTSQGNRNMNQTLMPPRSPTMSVHSRESATDPSDLDALEDPAVRQEKRRHRYRWSRADATPLAPPPPIGQNPGARTSNSSLGSTKPRKSFTGDSQLTQSSNMDASSTSHPSAMNVSSRESAELLNAQNAEAEKKGFFGRMKAKMQQRSEDKRERDVDRAKSPPRIHADQANSRNSLSAFAYEHLSPRGRSFDKPREEALPVVHEKGPERSGSKTPMAPQAVQQAPAPASMPAAASVSAVPSQGQTMVQEASTQQAPESAPAPVSVASSQGQAVVQEQSTQQAPESAPAMEARTAPSMAPLMAAAAGPFSNLSPGAVAEGVQSERSFGTTTTEHPQASTQFPVQQSADSTQLPSVVAEQAPAQAPVAEPKTIREVNQQPLPSGPRWTRIPKSVVSPEVLVQVGEDFEELETHVIIKREVPPEEVQELAGKTTTRLAAATAEVTNEMRNEQDGRANQATLQAL